ncbi:hypothetical protein AN958_05452 [Leucoagaricus sp. SymC.cos]|nr:hypothetical protein AN958_05452 [Leucoagaricus sp. SymC.cos]
MDPSDFDERAVLSYLGLPPGYEPSPSSSTIQFLRKHLSQLPPNILCKFSSITTPKLRTILTPIRNRRLRYVNTHPAELDFISARSRWPELWEGREQEEEKQWAQEEFLKGERKYIGNIGSLLRDYEEEREAERIRSIRRELAETTTIPEEEEEEEEDTENEDEEPAPAEEESEEEKQRYFERLIRERFIYGLLPGIDYDKVDYDESLDVEDDRETQDRWFDEDD